MSTVFSTRLTSPITKREYYISVFDSDYYGYQLTVHQISKVFFFENKKIYSKDFGLSNKAEAIQAAETLVKNFTTDPIFLYNENTTASNRWKRLSY